MTHCDATENATSAHSLSRSDAQPAKWQSDRQDRRQEERHQPNVVARRSFLALAAATMTSSVCAGDGVAASGESINIVADPGHDLMRVRIEMDVQGNVNVPSDPLVSRKSKVTLPIKSQAVLDYEERYHRSPSSVSDHLITGVERYYHEAHTTNQLNRTKSKIELRDSVRQTQVRRDTLPEVVYCVEDYFTNDELRLLRVPVASSAIDQWLPTASIHKGYKYQPGSEAIRSVLNLTSVQSSDVIVEVADIDSTHVKFHLRGKVEGSAEGVPTTLKTIGKLTFDREQGVCSWLAIAVHETRDVGKAEPGFDVAATIKMVRQPLPRVVGLPAKKADMALQDDIPRDRMYVDLQSKYVGVSAVMDRRWRMMADMNGHAMMRMIDNDRSIAQCNLRPLAKLKAGEQWTLEAFQKDVERTLGNDLSELIEADQRVSSAGLRVLRITAHGQVQGVPIQWIILHFSDDTGRRVLATFTMSGSSIEAFAGNDIQLADSLSFLDTTGGSQPISAEVAAKSTRVGDDEVNSASDIR